MILYHIISYYILYIYTILHWGFKFKDMWMITKNTLHEYYVISTSWWLNQLEKHQFQDGMEMKNIQPPYFSAWKLDGETQFHTDDNPY